MFTFLKNSDHGETVYNMIERHPVPAPSLPRYRSRYSCFVRQESACNKSGCYRTMGLPRYHQCPPDNFLRKQSKAPISVLCRPCTGGAAEGGVPTMICQPVQTEEANQGQCQEIQDCTSGSGGSTKDATCGSEPAEESTTVPVKCRIARLCCNVEKPPVPLSCCGFGVIPRGCKDFLRDNALHVVRQPARIPVALVVDQPSGHRYDWCSSGLPRRFVCKEDYGQLPAYLVQRNKELVDAEKEMKCKMEERDRATRAVCRHLEDDERAELLAGLKAHWAATFRDYQALPLKVDTQGNIKRKSELEQELKGLEKDIQLMERHNHIFLANSDKSFYMA